MGDSSIDALMTAFRSVPKPRTVEGCKCGYCPSTEDCLRLLEGDPSTLSVSDLLPYVSSVLQTVGSSSDFTFLLPTLLLSWGKEITTRQSGYVEQLHAALTRESFFSSLPNRLRLAVTQYMRRRILEVLGQQHSLDVRGKTPVHEWIWVVGSYGVITQDVPALWTEWWQLSYEGYCVAAVQFASLLICDRDRNPVFAAWTPTRGGGPPCPWEYASAGFDERWDDANISFLQEVLSVPYLEERLQEAEQRMLSEDSVSKAKLVRATLSSEPAPARARISFLLAQLGTPSSPEQAQWWPS